MTPIQQMLLGVGAKKKTYLDDLFTTYLYKGTNGAKTANTGLDMTKGGMIWIKNRDTSGSTQHVIMDTVRGANEVINSDSSGAEFTGNYSQAFTSTGWTMNNNASDLNQATDYASWNFRTQKGFFDIVTYNGSSSAQNISHSLGCQPGMIIIKKRSGTDNWAVWHKSLANKTQGNLALNDNGDATNSSTIWNNTAPTASVFSVGDDGAVNASGSTYVAYLFAGGESTAATAVSIGCNGSGQKLSWAAHNDFHLDGDFTIECWVYPREHSNEHIFSIGNYTSAEGVLCYIYGGKLYVQTRDTSGNGTDNLIANDGPPLYQWTHVAVVKSGSTVKVYQNGTLRKSFTHTDDFGSASNKEFYVGGSSQSDGNLKISNLRLVKGTAVYTSSFRPPTEPLTNITNTKLLCCNNASVTGSTVTPGTITDNGSVSPDPDSPFDDPAGFAFGENGDQNIIKCGSYRGNGDDGTDIEINLGWEPTWLLVKQTANDGNWQLVDSATKWPISGHWETIRPNVASGAVVNDTETGIQLTPTGFKIVKNWGNFNTDGDTHVFMAIRRPDGYVGKPADAGTDVFAMDTQVSNGDPMYISNFVVDYSFQRHPTDDGTSWQANWWSVSRLQGQPTLNLNNDIEEQSGTWQYWDYSNGYGYNGSSSYTAFQAWMWKRHTGFDMVAYTGDGVSGRQIPHSLNRTPEMMWVKCRNNADNWIVYHKGLDGGTNPEQKYLKLNTTNSEYDDTHWNDTAPNSTYFTLGSDASVNAPNNNKHYIALLFASVDGISKVGYYSGWDGTPGTIECGFQPRFIFIKKATGTGGNPRDWHVFDTVRGIAGSNGNDARLEFNNDDAEFSGSNYLDLTSSGFSPKDVDIYYGSSDTFIFYAHA